MLFILYLFRYYNNAFNNDMLIINNMTTNCIVSLILCIHPIASSHIVFFIRYNLLRLATSGRIYFFIDDRFNFSMGQVVRSEARGTPFFSNNTQ